MSGTFVRSRACGKCRGKWAFRVAALCLAIGIEAAQFSIYFETARADTPWSNLLTTSRVEADPATDYILKEAQGPWIIIACSFSGTNAKKEAHDLALELRKRYRLEAFIYDWDLPLDDPNGNVQPLFASPHRHVYEKVTENPKAYSDGKIKEIAVVVGNFAAVDDPEAQRTLKKLKAADPECLHTQQDDRSLSGWRALQAKVTGKDLPQYVESRKQNGPLAHAFITCNPLLPEDYFAPKGGLDDLVVKMNKDVKHSLLDCPGKYTVQVAHFSGEVIINQNDIRAIENGSKAGPESTRQGLATAAQKAHDLTEALRIKGYEAYEFHDLNSSVVTVGSFDSVGTLRPDGQVEYNPQVQRYMEGFGIHTETERGKPALKLRSLVGIFFDAQPIPVPVPKPSIRSRLSQRPEFAGQ